MLARETGETRQKEGNLSERNVLGLCTIPRATFSSDFFVGMFNDNDTVFFEVILLTLRHLCPERDLRTSSMKEARTEQHKE